MKRFLALLLSLLFILALGGCGLPFASVLSPAQTGPPATAPSPAIDPSPSAPAQAPALSPVPIEENGTYDGRDGVALYIHTYGRLPGNYITKREARSLGWEGGGLEAYAPGKCIGGDPFGNYEGLLPDAPGRFYTECDIGVLGKSSRGAKRIVFSNDGLIYYTDDHYDSFMLLYGEE